MLKFIRSNESTPVTGQSLDHTQHIIEQGIAAGDHIGAQLCVTRGDDTLIDRAFGKARLGVEMTPDHLCVWMSSGKPITAVAVLQLAEQDRLDLDQPVADHIPAFKENEKDHITPRHLLTHTAGKRRVETGYPDATWEQMVSAVCVAKLRQGWTPEERGAYDASASWIVLGELIQRITGQRLSDYISDRVLDPLGMHDCYLGMPARTYHRRSRDIAVMHSTTGDEPRPLDWHTIRSLSVPMPGRNFLGPANQLARFYRSLLSGGSLDGQRVLQPRTVDDFTARHRTDVVDETFHHEMDFGLGVLRNLEDPALRATMPYGFGPHASELAFGHGGQGSSVAFADPAHDLAVALVWNGVLDEKRHQPRLRETLAALYQDLGLTAS